MHLHMQECVHMEARRQSQLLFLRDTQPCLFKTGSLIGLEYIKFVRLTGQ